MQIILGLLAIASLAAGCFVMQVSQSAIHEIYAGVLFLCFAVFLAATAIISAIDRAAQKIALSQPSGIAKDESSVGKDAMKRALYGG